MPVGCFPSFRRKIKKFNKGKAPLSKKEEAENDVSHKNLKPTEENNHAEAKAETSIKVEQQSGLAQQRQEEEKKAQKTNKKTFEQVAEVHQSAECAANELVTSSEPTEHIKEIDESHTYETASSGATMMEHEDARETATTSEIEPFCEAPPKTEIVEGRMGVRGLTIPQEAEPPCDAPFAEVTVEHEEELQSESVPPTEGMTGLAVDQEVAASKEAEPPTKVTMEHVEDLQCESVPLTERTVEFAVSQEITVPQETEPTCNAPPTEATMDHEEVKGPNLPHEERELQCKCVPPREGTMKFGVDQEPTISQGAEPPCDAPFAEVTVEHEEELQSESVLPTEGMTGLAVGRESTISQEAEFLCTAAPTMMEQVEVQSFSDLSEKGVAQEFVQSIGGKPAQVNESGHPINNEEKHKDLQNSFELQANVLPKGFHWATVSVPLPEGAIDIHELHLPMHVGLVETEKGKIPCKYLRTKGSFYAGIDGREEDFTNGKILCLDPTMAGSIEIEWIHVSTSDIRSRNLVAGARDASGKLLYIARGMIPLTGPYPYYELSSGWVTEDLEYAHLPYDGVEWEQRDFDVLAWKPKCC